MNNQRLSTLLILSLFLFSNNIFGGNIIIVSSNAGSAVFPFQNGVVNYPVTIEIRDIDDGNQDLYTYPVAAEYGSNYEPVFLVARDIINDEILDVIPINGETFTGYNFSIEGDENIQGCHSFRNTFDLFFSYEYLCNEEQAVLGYTTIEIVVLAGNASEHPTSFFVPQHPLNQSILGIGEEYEEGCVTYGSLLDDIYGDCITIAERRSDDLQDIDVTFVNRVYPNPTSSEVSISWTNKTNKIEIFNSTGTIVHSFVPTDSENIRQISTKDWKMGYYFIRISDPEKSDVLKLLKL